MNRRQLLQSLSAAGLVASLPAQAQYTAPNSAPVRGAPSPGAESSLSGVVVVELANFRCDRCRAVNDHFERLKRAAASTGLDIRFAPVAWENQSLWPDRVYYAVRDLYPQTEGIARDILFDGIHREGMGFENLAQVVSYFERRQLPRLALEQDPSFNLAQVADRAASEDVLYSEMKAGRLVELSGAQEVPVFVWVHQGDVIKALSPADAKEPIALVQMVYRALSTPLTQK